MPLYKGTVEITGGGLYKGTTEIENGLKTNQFFYENLSTISWVQPTGQGLTYSTPTPQTQTKDGGVAMDTVTFTITNATANIQGTVAIAGMPPGLTFTQVNSGGGLGNTITITINGTMPEDSYFNTLLTISGITGSTNYNAHFLMCGGGGTNTGAGGGGVRTSYGSVSGGGAAAESQLAMVAGKNYVITINNPSTISTQTSCSAQGYNCPGSSGYVVFTARAGGSVSIVGDAISKTVLGGAAGSPNNPDVYAGNSNGRITANGQAGGCGGGARTYSGNLSYVTASGGSGTAGQGFGGGQAGPNRNSSGFGGGGGAGSAGGNTGSFQSNNVTGSAGLPLLNNIMGDNYKYASGTGAGQINSTNYGAANGASSNGGDPSRMGVFILRMPTANFGSITGTINIDYTKTTIGTETLLKVFGGNGSANGGVGKQLTYTA
tara:strand:- start:1099 stop:2400 length:1302 start_codon:yes stop_codon:yes gene_type:complete